MTFVDRSTIKLELRDAHPVYFEIKEFFLFIVAFSFSISHSILFSSGSVEKC